jgi:hypothetical protein
MSSSHQEQITPAFSVGAGVGGRRGRAGGKCAGVKFCPRAAAAPGVSGQAKPKKIIDVNQCPRAKKSPGVGGPERWEAPSYDAHLPVLVLFVEWGNARG